MKHGPKGMKWDAKAQLELLLLALKGQKFTPDYKFLAQEMSKAYNVPISSMAVQHTMRKLRNGLPIGNAGETPAKTPGGPERFQETPLTPATSPKKNGVKRELEDEEEVTPNASLDGESVAEKGAPEEVIVKQEVSRPVRKRKCVRKLDYVDVDSVEETPAEEEDSEDEYMEEPLSAE